MFEKTGWKDCFPQRFEMLLAVSMFGRYCPSPFFSDGRKCFRSHVSKTLIFHDMSVTRPFLMGLCCYNFLRFSFLNTLNTEYLLQKTGRVGRPKLTRKTSHRATAMHHPESKPCRLQETKNPQHLELISPLKCLAETPTARSTQYDERVKLELSVARWAQSCTDSISGKLGEVTAVAQDTLFLFKRSQDDWGTRAGCYWSWTNRWSWKWTGEYGRYPVGKRANHVRQLTTGVLLVAEAGDDRQSRTTCWKRTSNQFERPAPLSTEGREPTVPTTLLQTRTYFAARARYVDVRSN